DFDYSREGWERLVEETFSGLIPSCAGFFPELYERFVQPDAWEIFEDVRPTLDRLAHAGIRMAVVSNWDERLRPLLQQLRLNHYFETLHISCEAGAPKPSPIIFAQAAAGLGLPPQEILHVGDSFEMDFEGARDAGFQSRHLCRGAG